LGPCQPVAKKPFSEWLSFWWKQCVHSYLELKWQQSMCASLLNSVGHPAASAFQGFVEAKVKSL